MEPNTSPSIRSKEPQSGEFSAPKCWCESTGHYTNAEGQQFALRVRGTNPDAVVEYLKAVRVAFEVVPLSQARPEELEPPKDSVEQRVEQSADERTKEPPPDEERDTELDLEVAMEVVEAQGVEAPYLLRCMIDPYIAYGTVCRYTTSSSAASISVTVTASSGGVAADLYRGSQWLKGGRADTYPPNPPNPSLPLWGPPAASARFQLTVRGLTQNNYYSVSSSVRLV